ncbi:MAG: CoA-binding protein [Gemmatimonadales bacterium]|nr:CoA-binding protein [Gemmatimonadales bacterium]
MNEGINDGPAFANPADEQMRAILAGMKRVAVVGISPKEDRASHGIAKFLLGKGIEVVGVNPMHSEPIMGIEIYSTLADVPGKVDIVDIFRRSDTVPPIVNEAIARQDACVWLQEGVVNEEAAAAARAAGLDVIMDRCLYKDWLRLLNG